MRQVYSRSFTVTFTTGDSGYVFSEKIDPGYILHVHSCFAYAPERDANDKIVIGLRNGGQDVILRAVSPLATQEGECVVTDFFVGEGDQVYGYFANAENNDKLGINLNGVLMTLGDWESMKE